MAIYRIPVFEKGSILTKDMLDRIKQYSIDLNNLQVHGYGNGILQGFELSVLDQYIQINPGILVYNSEVYFFDEVVKVPYMPENTWQSLKIKMGSRAIERSFLIQNVEPILSTDIEDKPDQIELCRFRLQNGAILRSTYRSFQDISTEYDTLNIVEAKWAAYGKSSVSAVLLAQFVKEAIAKGIQNQDDYMFVQQILASNGRSINRSIIELYISKRLQKTYEELSNSQIYEELCNILKHFQSEAAPKTSRMRENRRIIVD